MTFIDNLYVHNWSHMSILCQVNMLIDKVCVAAILLLLAMLIYHNNQYVDVVLVLFL